MLLMQVTTSGKEARKLTASSSIHAHVLYSCCVRANCFEPCLKELECEIGG